MHDMHILYVMGVAKTRITMLLDSDVLAFFKRRAARPGAEPYQTQINRVLRQYTTGVNPSLSEAIQHVAERVARYPSIRPAARPRGSGRRARAPGRRALHHTVKAVIRPGDASGWVAECVDVPVVTQGATLDEITASLQEAVALHLAEEEPEALGFVPDPSIVVILELPAPHA
jgi:predicted RNase H-like HicB family nuclease